MGVEPLVDAHVHLYADADADTDARPRDRQVILEYGDDPGVTFCESPGSVEALSSVYGGAGFKRAIIAHMFDTERALTRARAAGATAGEAVEVAGEALRASNRWIASVVAASPVAEVLISIDPTVLPAQTISAHVAELAAAGVLGVKLHPVAHGFMPAAPALHPMYELCADAGLVVLSHSGGLGSARLRDFVPVLRKFPDLRLVLAHMGGAAWAETAAFAAEFPQVVFDLSEVIEWVGAPLAPSAADLSRLIRKIGADRVMLGSDFPRYDPVRTADRVAGLPKIRNGQLAAVLGGTAMRVFGLA
jgi:predicted TIM-barrel fold metal-dependent hydrolase